MSTRHRFAGVHLDALCAQSFGGVVRCNLPFASDWHYADQEHPFTPSQDYPDECAWPMQQGDGGRCCGDVSAPEHQLPPAPKSEVVAEPITMTMEYAAEEPPTERLAVAPGWGNGHVYPPDEDALAQDADAYRWNGGPFAGSGPAEHKEEPQPSVNEEAPRPEWSFAVEWLQSEEVSLNYGPWPVRKFLLCDEASGNSADERWVYEEYLASLDKLGQEYAVDVYRPLGRAWRFAMVTWSWAYGMDTPDICTELAAAYG
jgi:hypothetical protein